MRPRPFKRCPPAAFRSPNDARQNWKRGMISRKRRKRIGLRMISSHQRKTMLVSGGNTQNHRRSLPTFDMKPDAVMSECLQLLIFHPLLRSTNQCRWAKETSTNRGSNWPPRTNRFDGEPRGIAYWRTAGAADPYLSAPRLCCSVLDCSKFRSIYAKRGRDSTPQASAI